MQISSNLLATGEKLVPIAAKRGAQTCGVWQTWIVFARFNAAKITGTHANVLGQFFLSQIPSRPQTRHVSLETFSEWTDIGLARGHRTILSNDIFNQRSGTVIAMALTSQPQRAGFPLTLELAAANRENPG